MRGAAARLGMAGPGLQVVAGLALLAWAGEAGYYWVAGVGALIVVDYLLGVYVVGRRRG